MRVHPTIAFELLALAVPQWLADLHVYENNANHDCDDSGRDAVQEASAADPAWDADVEAADGHDKGRDEKRDWDAAQHLEEHLAHQFDVHNLSLLMLVVSN